MATTLSRADYNELWRSQNPKSLALENFSYPEQVETIPPELGAGSIHSIQLRGINLLLSNYRLYDDLSVVNLFNYLWQAFTRNLILGLRIIPGDSRRPATVARELQRIYGIEASLNWQPGDEWKLGSTATWTEGKFRNNNGDFVALNSLVIAPLKLSAYVQHETDFSLAFEAEGACAASALCLKSNFSNKSSDSF